MVPKEASQSAPDRHLGLQVDPPLDQLVQGFQVDPRQGQAYTPLLHAQHIYFLMLVCLYVCMLKGDIRRLRILA